MALAGDGSFAVDAMPGAVTLDFPPGCVKAMGTLILTSFQPPGGFPPNATLMADTTDDGVSISGYKYPLNQCDPAFSSCGVPF